MAAATTDADARLKPRPAVEVPTVLLLVFVFAAWLSITAAFGHLSLLIVAPVTALLTTFHSSLQHEMTHGHPTKWRPFNRLLAMTPLSLWIPFDRYLHTHHEHHINARLFNETDNTET